MQVHGALTPTDIEDNLTPMIDLGERLLQAADMFESKRHRELTLCMFLDEVNTSSTMGVFKELIIDRRLNGRELPPNMVVIAACNPAREKLVHLSAANARREELGKEWAMGHYQVHPLPLSIEQVTWDYGSLTKDQEEEFVKKRLGVLYKGADVQFPYHEQFALAALICKSQCLTREFASQQFDRLKRHIVEAAPRPMSRVELEHLQLDLAARASSVVSLRDIQRVFNLFKFFNELLQTHSGEKSEDVRVAFFLEEDADSAERRRRAMLLTIGVVYYLRLSPEQRTTFEHELHQMPLERSTASELRLDKVLVECMDALIASTELEAGIARTTGLKENVFMVVVCCLARIPLMIVSCLSPCSFLLLSSSSDTTFDLCRRLVLQAHQRLLQSQLCHRTPKATPQKHGLSIELRRSYLLSTTSAAAAAQVPRSRWSSKGPSRSN